MSVVEENQLMHIDDSESKQWIITGFYRSYKQGVLNMEYTECMQDDVYTFFDGNEEGETLFGTNSCFEGYTDAHIEHSSVSYEYKEDEKRLYLIFGRGAESTVLNRSTSWSTIYICVSLTEEEMVFTKGTDGSGEGVVFNRLTNN